MILGAILDPYNPYAAAGGVVVSFMAIKVFLANRSFQIKFALVKLWHSALLNLHERCTLLLGQMGNDDERSNQTYRMETRALELVESDTYLQKVPHRSQGIDLEHLDLLRIPSATRLLVKTRYESNGARMHRICGTTRSTGVLKALKIAGEKQSLERHLMGY